MRGERGGGGERKSGKGREGGREGGRERGENEEREMGRKKEEREGRRGRKEGKGFLPCDSPGHVWCNIVETSAAVTNQLP